MGNKPRFNIPELKIVYVNTETENKRQTTKIDEMGAQETNTAGNVPVSVDIHPVKQDPLETDIASTHARTSFVTEEVRPIQPIIETHAKTLRPEIVTMPINRRLPSRSWKMKGPTGETILFGHRENCMKPLDYFN